MSILSANIGKVIYNKVNSTVACYPVTAAQGTAFPYLVYNTLMNDPDEVKSGTWVDNITVLLSIYGTTFSAVATLANSVRGTLNRLHGTTESVVVDTCNFITESDDYDNDLKAYIKIQEYKFRIKN
jgi:hypothetical protein